MLDNMCAKAYNSLREWEWKEYKKRKRLRLKNENFTVIASNCSGMFMYYDMGLRRTRRRERCGVPPTAIL